MKRVITAVFLLVLTIGSGIVFNNYMQNKVENFINILDEERQIVSETEKPELENAEKLNKIWDGEQTLMQAFLPHTKTTDIELCMYNLIDYARQGNGEEYLETLNECIAFLKRLVRSEKLTISNIF